MSDLSRATLRLVVDLQACQSPGSAHRGVGRYSKSLFEAMAAQRGERDLHLLASDGLPIDLATEAIPAARVHRLPPLPEWGSPPDPEGGVRDTLDGIALSAHLQSIRPDAIHVSHAFEGLDARVPLPSPSLRSPEQVVSATLYDLIPLRFPDHYFRSDGFRRWYHHRLAWLRTADLLLAISESSRRDAIELLGIEPERVVTIHGGVSPCFRPPADRESARRTIAERYGLPDRFVLYAGGDEFRKNLAGAIRGFAAVPAAVRAGCPLVIVCSLGPESRARCVDLAREAGLAAEELVLTGFVPEEDLVALYGACDLFIFPSLYEGLGLPVLEAMACGAPVIGSDRSSISEVIAEPDALFDPDSPASAGDRIAHALSDPSFADGLRAHGLERSRSYSWERTAALALDAIDAAVARKREARVRAARDGVLPRKRLAVLTPLPPSRSGIADYNAEFLPHLARHFDLDVYVEERRVDDERLLPSPPVYSAKDFPAVARQYDAILYELGNSHFHAHMLPLLEEFPGVIGLHDAYLSSLYAYFEFHAGQKGRYAREMLLSHGPRARRYLAPARGEFDPVQRTTVELPCTKWAIDRATGVISHSPFNLETARRHYGEGWLSPYRTIPQMVARRPPAHPRERDAARRELGFGPDDFVIATFGFVAWTKWGDRLLQGFLESSLRDDPRVHLVFAGQLARDGFGLDLEATIAGSGIAERIRVTGYLSNEDYEKYLGAADLAAQLRTKSRGGTPRGVLDCLAHGLPVIVNRDASYRDYPEGVVIGIAPHPIAEEIARALEAAHRDRGQLREVAAAGLEYIDREHHPAVCTAQYAAVIHECSARAALSGPGRLAEALAPHLPSCADPARASELASQWYAAIPTPSFARRRILVDVTPLTGPSPALPAGREIAAAVAELLCTDLAGVEPIAVEAVGDGLRVATAWLEREGLAVGSAENGDAPPPAIELRAGDCYVVVDADGEAGARDAADAPSHGSAEAARGAGATVISLRELLPALPSASEGAGASGSPVREVPSEPASALESLRSRPR